MKDDRKKAHQSDFERAKHARKQQEEALDDALKNTFPASDPVSIKRPTRPADDHNRAKA
jgi:hypothetical protein